MEGGSGSIEEIHAVAGTEIETSWYVTSHIDLEDKGLLTDVLANHLKDIEEAEKSTFKPEPEFQDVDVFEEDAKMMLY